MIKIITRKDRNGLFLYISRGKERMTISTEIEIDNTENFKDGRLGRRERLYREKNKRIEEIISKTNIILLEEKAWERVKERVLIMLGKKKERSTNLSSCIEEYSGTRKGRTRELYEYTMRKVRSFKDVDSRHVSIKWLMAFEEYCSRTMKINGYAIHLRNIRTVLNWLIDSGEEIEYPFRKHKIKREETRHRALEREEALDIIRKDCTPKQKVYRDFFLLSLYLVGINPKDLLLLKPSDMENGRIRYRRHKTGKLFDIKVEPEALHLIYIYSGKKYLLNFVETSKDYLHFIMACDRGLGRVKKGLSLYWARHTWATLAYKAGVDKDTISLALGHSFGVSVTDIYIRYDTSRIDTANKMVLDYIKQSPAFTSK